MTNSFFDQVGLKTLHNLLDGYVSTGRIQSEEKKVIAQSLQALENIDENVLLDLFSRWFNIHSDCKPIVKF